MKKTILAACVCVLLCPAAMATKTGDVTKPIRQFIDGFNSGNVQRAYAAYATGDITIVDEFAPHLWTGPHAAQDWAADYEKHAKATGVTDGLVKYGNPTRTEIEGDVAYVIMPTMYVYKEYGTAMAEEGQITVVLHLEAGKWKMRGWTWTGVKPHLAK
ncbi:MAG TPA: nuclear transport factor 2 family protein [Terracidiphilus sp.]|nr:nuclear transport factor 2 family protein [Terracidiphilus sp.]